ncbi:hypothetical protein [Aquimarina brevivitae]|uniref:Uncharacterized protein n=1 Tax=Aquimarina brevivitae TaxID=323412 RepID=A0A4Q7PI26_9FLAO|nr:hypothetical protein [Aquimarina brevivitae]RZS99460.1 hypothetical protein EV197_0670 [Aquimarina brevivitae]
MKQNYKQLYKIVTQFEGMPKIEVFDILHKIEVLLYYAPGPLTRTTIKNLLDAEVVTDQEIDPFHFTILPNGNFCEFIDSNSWLHIYKEQKRGLWRLPVFDTYYFKTRYAPLELVQLTRNNLITHLENKWEETSVRAFLDKHHPTDRDKHTGKFLVLRVK